MEISVRPALASDVPNMLRLIKELATFEKAPDEVITTEDSMTNDGFGDNPIYKAFVAEVDEKVVGLAICYVAYSTWKGKMVYLDDLIVTESMRGKGIGKMLFDAVGKMAKDVNANHYRWHVLDWNTPAVEFYKKYDASFDPTWITCKLNRNQLEQF